MSSASRDSFYSLNSSSIMVAPLFDQCLWKFLDGIDFRVTSSDRIKQVRTLPASLASAIYLHIAQDDKLRDLLLIELSDVHLFCMLLKYRVVHENLLKIFKIMMSNKKPLAMELQRIFVQQATYTLNMIVRRNNEKLIAVDLDQDVSESDADVIDGDQLYVKLNENRSFWRKIDDGLRLGTFLCETGMFEDAIKVLSVTKHMIIELEEAHIKQLLLLHCYQKLIHAQTLFCCFKEALVTTTQANMLIEKIQINYSGQNDDFKINGIPDHVLADFYQELSMLYFYRSEYETSYYWGLKALHFLRIGTPPRITVNVLRQAAKSCVVTRKFQLAVILVNRAVKIAENAYGRDSSVYADALLDKAFLLLNIDYIPMSVEFYQEAVNIKKQIYGDKNLHMARIFEDLGYALYVHEYLSSKFDRARYYVDAAISVMTEIASSNAIMLSSAKRVKALILEEVAVTHIRNLRIGDIRDFMGLLKESEELHRSALHLSLDAFGELNVQTAKHYGNLGRLYQSMKRFKDAEEMHKRAINIKRKILGECDFEVALSIGHLASLYNYQMMKYREAEELYLKSVAINTELFGPNYSGLKYDYKGLIHVYERLGDTQKLAEMHLKLSDWQLNREVVPNIILSDEEADELDIEDIKLRFTDGNNSPIVTKADSDSSDASYMSLSPLRV